jgi:multidrug efflux pump subunit AcrA (membrane-fusion protein)
MSSHSSLNHATVQKPSRKKKLILLAAIIGVTLLLVTLIFNNPPQSKRFKPSKAPQMTVETKILVPESYQVMVESFGTVKPRTDFVMVDFLIKAMY